MQLDHVFILTRKFAPEADLLGDFGLVEGTANDHPGQGTANRRFFFSNTALELLYVRDVTEAESGPGQRLRLPERASNRDASPIGLVMRGNDNSGRQPFAGWRYQPMYSDPGVRFLVGENSDRLSEPLCICLPDDAPSRRAEVQSKAPFTTVTALRLHVPDEAPSPVLEAVAKIDGIELHTGSAHFLELVFCHEMEGQRREFRPHLPLAVCW